MKKILLFACVVVMAFASCGNKTATPAEAVDSTVVENVAEDALSQVTAAIKSGDATQVKTVLATLQTTYAKLVEEGKLDEAKNYASAIQKFVSENSDAIQKVVKGEASVTTLLEGIKNLPTAAEVTAEEAAAAVQADAKALVNGAKDAAETAVENKVNEVKDAAKQTVNSAKDAAAKKVNEAVEPAAKKAAEAKAAVDAAKATGEAAKKLFGK